MSNIIVDPKDLCHEEKTERPTTQLLRKNIMTALVKYYPHMSVWPGEASLFVTRSPWLIDIKDFETGGVVTIRNLLLSGSMGVTLHLHQVQQDPDQRSVVRYVGELLERANIAREKALDMREAIYGMPRNWRGNAILDMS